MAEIYELDAPDYTTYEVDWLQNNNRGDLNTDFVKWFNNEKELLNTKVKKQLINFKDNLLSNVVKPFSGPTYTNFIKDFQELEKVLSKSIDNATLGPSGKTKIISVAENLKNNEVDRILLSLKIQGFDGTLLPDGKISVPYYDKSSNYTPKDSWTVKNEGRSGIITHNETGLKFQLDSKGLSFIDDNNFKIDGKKIDYESLYTPVNVNLYPTGNEFDPMDDPGMEGFDKEIKKLTQEQIDNYYQKGITDGLSNEQRAHLYFSASDNDYADIMGADDFKESPNLPDARLEEQGYKADVTDRNIISDIEVNNNIPKGSISKLGLALDPIAEGLEFALKGIGLGSVAQWWVKAEAANFLAGLIRGAGAGAGVAQLGQSQALMGKEITGDSDAIMNAFAQNLSSQMKLSPSLWMENKYAESNLGKGETPSQQAFGWVKNMFGASQ